MKDLKFGGNYVCCVNLRYCRRRKWRKASRNIFKTCKKYPTHVQKSVLKDITRLITAIET